MSFQSDARKMIIGLAGTAILGLATFFVRLVWRHEVILPTMALEVSHTKQDVTDIKGDVKAIKESLTELRIRRSIGRDDR